MNNILKILTLEQAEEWDKIVQSFSKYDIYYMSGYVKAFKIHGDGEPFLFYYEEKEENNVVRGINISMKRDIALDPYFKNKLEKNQYFDFATPYGYGGWLIEGQHVEKLFKTYSTWCKKNKIISEFIRFHPVIENHINSTNFYDVIPLGYTITMDLSSPNTIWNNITSQNRNKIRKAQKNGVKIYNGRYPDIYEIFRNIYNETMKRDNAKEYYYFNSEFYKSILNDLPQNAQIFYAVYQNKIIAASIMLFANKKMNYHLSGSVKEYSYLASTNLMLYEAALWGCANGYETLYLGGGIGSEEDNLYKFKKSFYRKEDTRKFYIGKKIYIQDEYDRLVKMHGETDKNFFPKYRA